MTAGCRARPRITAFSITTLWSPTLIRQSSALSTAPNSTRASGPMRTAPHRDRRRRSPYGFSGVIV